MSTRLPAVTSASSSSGNGLPALGENGVEDNKKPKAFKFGQVDQNLLMSRLYSTPLKQESHKNQKYMLDMSATNFQKPLVRKLEPPLPKPEPVVSLFRI